MSKKVTLYKVFIASPSDVQKERKRFRDVIMSFNERYAIKYDTLFMPVYWEQNTGGFCLPQNKANKQLDECDFSIIVFGKHWGTPPRIKSQTKITSGTEEEFYRSITNYNNPNNQMKDIVVLFKELTSDVIDDPGYNTKQILNFKKKIKKLGFTYLPYAGVNEFSSVVANHLNEWLDNHILGGGKIKKDVPILYDYFKNKHIEHIQFPGEDSLNDNKSLINKLRKAAKYADSFQVLKAQETYENLCNNNRCIPVLNDYAKFLFRIGELYTSERLFEEILCGAKLEQNLGWMARATANLAIIFMSRGEHDKAISLLQKSIGYNQSLEHAVGMADNHRHLSNAFRLNGDLDLAEEHILQAKELFENEKLHSGLADSLADHGVILRIRGEFSESIANYKEAIIINEKYNPDKSSCRADYIDRLGTVYRIRGDLNLAKDKYAEALKINGKLHRRRGIAEVLGHMGLLDFYSGNFDDAIKKIESAISTDQDLNNKEGLGKHLLYKARIFHWKDELDRAQDLARQSCEINKVIGSKEGQAYALYILASIQFKTKEVEMAEKNIDDALLIWHKLKGGEGLAESNELKALIFHAKKSDKIAMRLINETLSFCETSGSKIMESSLLISRANILRSIGDDNWRVDLKKSLEICKKTGEKPKQEMIETFLIKQDSKNKVNPPRPSLSAGV